MKKIVVLSLTLLAASVGMSLSGVARAEDPPAAPSSQTAAPKSDNGGMKDDKMGGMKMDDKKMEGMGKMKDCDKMMQSKMDDKGKTDSSKTGHGC
jgi:hypothetical protein